MTFDDALVDLESRLNAANVQDRRAAVARAAELLKQPGCDAGCRQRICALLEQTAARDLPTVREAAQNVLFNFSQGYNPSWLPDDRKHMEGASCPNCGNVNFVDKRIDCTERVAFVRGSISLLWVTCKRCNTKYTLEADCGPYR